MENRAGRSVAALAFVVVGALLVPAGANAAMTEVFRFGGTGCLEVGITVAADGAQTRMIVPPAFQPSPSAVGQLQVGVLSCDAFTVDGIAEGPARTAYARLGIQNPDGSAGRHSYLLWHLSTSAKHRSGMDRAGIAGGLVGGLRAEAAGAGLQQAIGLVPWIGQEHDIEAVTAPVVLPPLGPSSNWHEGPAGLARLSIEGQISSAAAGVGRLEVEAGSVLARLIGGTSATGVSVVATLDFQATVVAERPL